MDKNKLLILEKILKEFNEAKEICSKLYKKLENSKTKSECDELVSLYKQIVNNLKNIKEESRALDDVDIPEDYLGTEDDVIKIRENNCKNIECLTQQLRGCLNSYKKYFEMVGNKRGNIED